MAIMSISLPKEQQKEYKDYAEKRLWSFAALVKVALRVYTIQNPITEEWLKMAPADKPNKESETSEEKQIEEPVAKPRF